jgi:hypothetical protein
MRRVSGIFALACLAASGAVAQAPADEKLVLVPRDTPVELMATTEVSTATARPGMRVRLRVNRPVVVGGRMVIPVGTPAYGEVLEATDAGGLGKSGQMRARLTHLQLGEARIPLDGETSSMGRGAGSPAVAVAFGGVLGLFHRGNNAKIKAGELIAGFVAEDVTLELSGAVPRRVVSGETVPGS